MGMLENLERSGTERNGTGSNCAQYGHDAGYASEKLAASSLVPRPRPLTREKGSGDLQPIPRASLSITVYTNALEMWVCHVKPEVMHAARAYVRGMLIAHIGM